jgi:hypothetical protein
MPLRILSPIRKAKPREFQGKPAQAKLDLLNRKYSSIISSDLAGGLTSFSNRVDYYKMAEAVYTGDYKQAFMTLPTKFLPGDIEASMARLGISIEDASRIAAERIPFGRDVTANYHLDPEKNPVLRDYLDVRAGALVTNIEDNIQGNIQEVLRSGMQNKLNIDQISERLKSSGMGLNERQTGALLRLEDGWRKAGLPETQIMQQIEEQSARYLQQRCDMIARTEVAAAQNIGQMETWRAAIADGLLAEDAQKMWLTEGQPCEICADFSGQTIGIDEMWELEDGTQIDTAPAHPNCKCSVELVLT